MPIFMKEHLPALVLTALAFVMSAALWIGGLGAGFLNGVLGVFLCLLGAAKLLDYESFTEYFPAYDLYAKRDSRYACVYPFKEIGLGLLYLTGFVPFAVHIGAIGLMGLGAAGILQAVGHGFEGRCVNYGSLQRADLSLASLYPHSLVIALALLDLLR
jgi:hypothetical protein